ncbi:MAG TPA: sigma-70 family RNA polymerase sigma factor [Acidimicrobiales bacterium]|jgi:RNA polymerase sigma factor for flagellar operon FliA
MTTERAEITAEQRQREDGLVRGHLALVGYAVSDIANKVPRHVARADLESAAMEGLAQAARSYDDSRGIAFDRYASTRIRGALLDELRRRDWASRSVRSRARKVNTATDELTVKLGRTPSPDEVAAAAHVDAKVVRAVHEDVYRAAVLNVEALTGTPEGSSLIPADHETPDALLVERERRAYLLDAVTSLPDRLRHVVVGYFFDERPMQELADELGVTESRISQMRAEALVLLRDGLNSQLDPELLPEEPRSTRVANKRAAFYATIAASSDYSSRLSDKPTLTGAGARRPA